MIPIYPGAPWVPKFHGPGGDLKYQEWKEQIKGILEVQELTEAQKVAIVLGALSGEAKRQVDVLDQEDRERAVRIFTVLDALYVEKVPLSVRRAQFFGCVQRSDEPVQAYLLRLKELYCKLRQLNPDEAPTDSHLKDQFLLGLEGGPLLQALKMFARRNPDATFAQIQQEALLLEGEQQGTKWPEVVCAAVGGSNYSRSRSQTDWKQELKKKNYGRNEKSVH